MSRYYIFINGDTIRRTKTFKFLGIIVDENLKWNHHIKHVTNKISKGVGIFYKARKHLNKQTLMNLYYTFVYPYLIYGVEIWGNTFKKYLDPLFKVQKKIIRIITFSPYLQKAYLRKQRSCRFLNLLRIGLFC